VSECPQNTLEKIGLFFTYKKIIENFAKILQDFIAREETQLSQVLFGKILQTKICKYHIKAVAEHLL